MESGIELMAGSGGTLVPLGLALLGTGAAAGLLAGLLGVGGGIVIVPALYHLAPHLAMAPDVRMHVAVGTSLATIILTSLASIRAHARRGAVDTDLLRGWGPPLLLGVGGGALAAPAINAATLGLIFACTALGVAFYMAFVPRTLQLAATPPVGWRRGVLSAGVGALSTLMGIGGGTVMVPLQVLCGVPIHRAVGTAAAFGLLIGVPGSVGFLFSGLDVAGRPPFSLGYLSLPGLALIAPTSLLMAPVGARLAHALPPAGLRRAFALFLLLTALRMFLGTA